MRHQRHDSSATRVISCGVPSRYDIYLMLAIIYWGVWVHPSLHVYYGVIGWCVPDTPSHGADPSTHFITRGSSGLRRFFRYAMLFIPSIYVMKSTSFVESDIQTNATIADNRTMAQMLQAPIEGYEDAIVVPPINANNFELKQTLINLVQSNQFTGRQDPHNHLRFFNKVTSTFRHPEVQTRQSMQTPGSGISILLAVGSPSTCSRNLYCQWELSSGSGNALCILFPTILP
nr:reverse transcriptase domain-containing protein [Tanacetum cinerariifolium]